MEKDSIKISEKYGVNPSVEICTICGKDIGVILFGDSLKEEAPHKVCNGNLCEECLKLAEDNEAVYCFESEDGQSTTGRYVLVKKDFIKEIYPKYNNNNIIFVDSEVFKMFEVCQNTTE